MVEDELTTPPEIAEGSSDLAADLEELGPTFVKLGQLLSTRPDLLRPDQVAALERLQDECTPVPVDEIREVVESELGAKLERVFSSFEEVPLAVASLAQVHRATTRDGRHVAVKVQRPRMRPRIEDDLEVLAGAARFIDRHTDKDYGFSDLVETFRRSLERELDYQLEARNLIRIREILEPFPLVCAPAPLEGLSSRRVLTMELIDGRKVTEIGPLARIELDGDAIADQLFAAYLQQVLVAGFFHADPHPGNVQLTAAGRLALLDIGMVGALTPDLQDSLLRLLLALSDGRLNDVAVVLEELGGNPVDHDGAELRRRLAPLLADHRDAAVQDIPVGRLMLELLRSAADCGVRMPAELALLGKTLLHLDAIARALAPQFNPNEAVKRHVAAVSSERLGGKTSLHRILAASHDIADFVERLPSRANKILDRVANNEFSVKVDAIDNALLLQGAQTIANRIVLGLVLAALIVGAAMLMRVETSFRIFGYPGLAMLCFLCAAGGGVALVLQIVCGDVRAKQPRQS